MAFTTNLSSALLTTLSFFLLLPKPSALPSPLIEQLNQPPPPNFAATIATNCLHNPALRYCNSTSADTADIFKSTVVAAHLCNVSRSPGNCPSSFSSINLSALPNLAPLYLSFTFFWNYCPLSIQSIDLSHNSLDSLFPTYILNCTQIHSLDLSHNKLYGPLPLAPLALLTNLSHLNLSYNFFSPEFDAEGVSFLKSFNASSFLHSGLLQRDLDYGLKMTATILLLVGVSALAASGFGCLVWRSGRRHKFSVPMLMKATNNFSKDNLVEKREKADIYAGRLEDGKEVDIKMLRGRVSGELRRSFVEECRVLVKVRHDNVVEVLGWCDEEEVRAVVMERKRGVSVEGWLLQSPTWKERMKVALEVAEVMHFLEEEWPQIRCVLNTNTVMVDDDGKPFILKLRVDDHRSINTREVYKFGVFLLELIAKKHPREDFEGSESGFVDWIAIHQHDKLRNVMDEKIKLSAAAHEQAKQVIGIGLCCTDCSTDHLLTANEISSMLRSINMPSIIKSVDSHHRPRNKEQKAIEETCCHKKG